MPALYAIAGAWQIWGRYFMAAHQWWADPEYDYLLNGVTVGSGVAPWFVDHPGLPVQIFNALVAQLAWVSGAFAPGADSLAASAVSAPEQHLALISICLVSAQVAASVFLGVRSRRICAWPAVWLAQVGPIALVALFPEIYAGNRPEVYVVIFVTIALALMAPPLAQPTQTNPNVWVLVLMGACLGLAVSSKLSALWVALLLPLALLRLRAIAVVYGATAFALAISFIPIAIRIPALPTVWSTWNSYADSPLLVLANAPVWLPDLAFRNYWLTGLSLVAFVTTVLVVALAQRRFPRNLPSTPPRTLIFLALLVPLTVLQLTFVERWYSWWLIPLIPVTTFGLGLVAQVWLHGDSRRLPTLGVNLASLAIVVVLTADAFAALRASYPVERINTEVAVGPLKSSVLASTAAGSRVVYDYSIGWSHSPYGNECTSLIIGNSFAREIAFDEVNARCQSFGTAGFYGSDVRPIGPFIGLEPEAPLQHALYCADLARIADESGGLHIVTPDRDYAYINATTVNQEGGWRLSKVNSIDCTGSPVRNETPNPATVAARERIANMPIIGFLYRNWPWQ